MCLLIGEGIPLSPTYQQKSLPDIRCGCPGAAPIGRCVWSQTRLLRFRHTRNGGRRFERASAAAEQEISNGVKIGGKARDVGAFSIVDGYQSVGSIPVDVRGLGVDAYIGGCLKWLCGGPGTAFSWVRPELVETLRPRLTGWMSHQRPFGFEPTLDRRDDAWRFLHGTPNIPALYAARPGLEIINEVGIDAIRAKSTRQTSLLLSLAEGQGFRCSTPKRPEDRGGTVAIDIDHGYEISKTLKAANILCDYRPGAGIRLSPHFYNSDHEVETAIEAIAQIQRDGSWKAFLDHKSTVT